MANVVWLAVFFALPKLRESTLYLESPSFSPLKLVTLLDCHFNHENYCGFEPVHSQEDFRWRYSVHDQRLVAAEDGVYRFPTKSWFNEAYLYSALIPSPKTCLRIEFAYQFHGAGFIRLGLMPESRAGSSEIHPPDEFFFWNETRSGGIMRWLPVSVRLADPGEAFHLVFHAASNVSSKAVNSAHLQSIAVRSLPCDGGEVNVNLRANAKTQPCLSNLAPVCLNRGRCLRVTRREGPDGEPYCDCLDGWSGPVCEDRVGFEYDESAEENQNQSEVTVKAESMDENGGLNDVTLNCAWDKMTVTIPLMKLSSIGFWDGVEELDPPCLANHTCCMELVEEPLSFQLTFPFYKCGTMVQVEDKSILYMNSVLFKRKRAAEASRLELIRRAPARFIVDIVCRVAISDQIAPSYQIQDELHLNLTEEADIPLRLNMRKLSALHRKSEVALGDTMEFQIAAPETKSASYFLGRIVLDFEDCVAKSVPSLSPVLVQHPLISKGCPMDDSVRVSTTESGWPKFTFEAFGYVNPETAAAIPMTVECRLNVCRRKDAPSGCPRPVCLPPSHERGRRSSSSRPIEEDGDSRRWTVTSPVFIYRDVNRSTDTSPVRAQRVNASSADQNVITVDPDEAFRSLVLYVLIGILVLLIVVLLFSVISLLFQVRRLRRHLRLRTEVAFRAGFPDDSVYKSLDQTDYWGHFRRILMGQPFPGSNFSEGGEFDVAYDVVAAEKSALTRGEEVAVEARNEGKDDAPTDADLNDSSFGEKPVEKENGATDDALDDFSFLAEAGFGARSCETPSPTYPRLEERYRFPGSEMTREIYERRGVDLNNNNHDE